MFCSQCGKEASGKFCWNCGAPLHTGQGAQAAAAATGTTVAAASASAPPASKDWQNDVNYQAIINNPEVRDLLARQIPPTAHMSGEQFIDSCSKLMKSPIPMGPVIAITQDVYARLGVHMQKTRSQHYSLPPGRVIVSVLCTMARGGYKVQDVHQASDGCMLICEIPSDLLSYAGQLLVTIQCQSDGTLVNADTRIEGQIYDWGKSNRCLKQLFDGIDSAV